MYFAGKAEILIVAVLSLAGLAGANAWAQENVDVSTPEKAVLAYLRLDGDGAIFSESGRQSMQMLYPDLREVHYSERTSIVFLIANYRISHAKYQSGKAIVTVEYGLVGEVENRETFRPQDRIEKVDVGLVKVDGKWQIATDLWHHVLWKKYIAYLQDEQKRLDSLREQVAPHFKPSMFGGLIESIRRSTNRPSGTGDRHEPEAP